MYCLVSAQPEQRGKQRAPHVRAQAWQASYSFLAADMFFMDAAATRMSSLGVNPADGKRLWEESERMVKLAAAKGGF